jgi:hypothetical protein
MTARRSLRGERWPLSSAVGTGTRLVRRGEGDNVGHSEQKKGKGPNEMHR